MIRSACAGFALVVLGCQQGAPDSAARSTVPSVPTDAATSATVSSATSSSVEAGLGGALQGGPSSEGGPSAEGGPSDAQALDAQAMATQTPDAAATSASQSAEDCLATPTCPAGEAARRFVAASDASDPDLDCFRFLDGAGTRRDWTRARGCLERQAPSLACDGSSMGLGVAELALMRIDGRGGKTDEVGARALVDGCFDDDTRSSILDHAAARDRDPKVPPVDFCKDIGGTTLTTNECVSRHSKNEETARQLAAKAVVGGFDDAGKDLFASSEKDYDAYVTARGAYVYEVYIDGTIRNAMALDTEAKLRASRTRDLAELPRFVARDTPGGAIEAARRAAAAALAHASAATPAEKDALQKTQRTWEAYRDAELALYEHVFGPKQGADRVHDALLVRLESRRARDCAAPSASSE
jgi:Lysozyme inhibitor LprI